MVVDFSLQFDSLAFVFHWEIFFFWQQTRIIIFLHGYLGFWVYTCCVLPMQDMNCRFVSILYVRMTRTALKIPNNCDIYFGSGSENKKQRQRRDRILLPLSLCGRVFFLFSQCITLQCTDVLNIDFKAIYCTHCLSLIKVLRTSIICLLFDLFDMCILFQSLVALEGFCCREHCPYQ